MQSLYELLAEDILSHCAEGSILDLGTGPGWLLVKLLEGSPSVRPIGVDISPTMVSKARANVAKVGLSERIRVEEGNANKLPFADNSFDAVVSTGSFHHWKEPRGALAEVHRVLKPGSWALIYDLVSDTPKEVYEQAGRQLGRLKTMLFWLHSYEEPFYAETEFAAFGKESQLAFRDTHYVGIMCCLALLKPSMAGAHP